MFTIINRVVNKTKNIDILSDTFYFRCLVMRVLSLYLKMLNFNGVFKLIPYIYKILLYNNDAIKI